MFGLFQKKFSPPTHFSALAWNAADSHIRLSKIKHAQGKLEVLVFYSTYISLLTSCYFIDDADSIDLSLIEGINAYKDFLKLNDDDFMFDFETFLRGRGKDYTDAINKMLQNRSGIESEDGLFVPKFVCLFDSAEETDYNNVASSDLFRIIELFSLIKIELKNVIEPHYNSAFPLEGLSTKTLNANKMFYHTGLTKLDSIVVLPFQESRCQICGDFTDRTELKLKTIHDSELEANVQLPVCSKCSNKVKQV